VERGFMCSRPRRENGRWLPCFKVILGFILAAGLRRGGRLTDGGRRFELPVRRSIAIKNEGLNVFAGGFAWLPGFRALAE